MGVIDCKLWFGHVHSGIESDLLGLPCSRGSGSSMHDRSTGIGLGTELGLPFVSEAHYWL